MNKSKVAMIAAVAAIGFASPALAQSIPGYGPDGSVVALGHVSNAHQKSDRIGIQRHPALGYAARDGYDLGIPGYGPAGNVVTLGHQ